MMLLYVCTHVCMYVCIYVCTHAYADIDYMRRYKYVYRAPGPVTEERRRAAGGDEYIHTYIYTHAYAHIHLHTYTRTHISACVWHLVR